LYFGTLIPIGYNYTLCVKTSATPLRLESPDLTDIESYTEEIWIKVLSTAATEPSIIKLLTQTGNREVRIDKAASAVYLKARNLATVTDMEDSKTLVGLALKSFWYHVLVQYSKPTTTMRLFWNHRLAASLTLDYIVFYKS